MIHLSLLQEHDLDTLLPIINTPDALHALGYEDIQLRIEDIAAVLTRTAPGTTSRTWAIVTGEQIVGCISLNNIHPVNRMGQINNRLVASQSGWMVGMQAVEKVAAIGFNELGLWRIECTIHGDNRQSLLLCERLKRRGLVKEGVRRKSVWRCGQWHDEHLYAILREDYREGDSQ